MLPNNRYMSLKNRYDIQRQLSKKDVDAPGRDSQLLAAMQAWYMGLNDADREVADQLITAIAVEMGWKNGR